MKKIFAAILCFSLLFVNSVCFAEQNSVKLLIDNVPLQSVLKDSYTAYRVTFTNTTKNPMRIEDLKFFNKINSAHFGNEYVKMSKGDKACLALAPLTLGITFLFVAPHLMNNSEQFTNSLNEAKRFDAAYGGTNIDKQANGKLIFPNQSISFEFLTNINEQPYIEGLFHDIVTNQFVTINNSGSIK